MVKKQPKTYFPSQAVSDAEKSSLEYGMQVANSIESEWFKKDSHNAKYYTLRDNFHKLRLYARGEQSIQKYKDELSINGDLSYLNLDWKPVPIIPKFVDIVVNGIGERVYKLNSYSQDPSSLQERTDYIKSVVEDMKTKDFKQTLLDNTGVDMFKNNPEELPANDEELSVHMQLNYKQSIEIAHEEALSNLFDLNKYDNLKKRVDYDLTVLGIGCVKNTFNTAEGIKIEYVDPSDLVYSYTESPYFDDLYYVGEVRRVSIPELKKQFPNISQEDLEKVEQLGQTTYKRNRYYTSEQQEGTVDVLYFEYKTFKNQTYKVKRTASGADKAIKKPGDFTVEGNDRFTKSSRAIEVLYCGAKVIGHEKLLKWELAENMTRPKSDITKVQMSYSIAAPRLYKGKIESLVGRMTTFADMIQLTHLKLQQVMSRMVPDLSLIHI